MNRVYLDVHRGRWCVAARSGNPYLWYRVVVWNELGRELRADEQVHHINGDCTDDRVENLEVLSASAHTRRHLQERTSKKVTLRCPECGDEYCRYPSLVPTSRFCSRACRAAAQSAGRFLTGRALAKSQRETERV